MEMRRPFKPYPIEAPVETRICQELCPCCSNQTLTFRKSYREATTAPYGQSSQTSYPLRMVTNLSNTGLHDLLLRLTVSRFLLNREP